MDIVVRTPHGDADVTIVSQAPTTTLGDVIAAVTGQAVPRLALVDGRVVVPTTPLDDVGLLVGSVVTTEPALPASTSVADVDIVQIAGHGAGRIVRLGPGRYRFGSGRRAHAAELDVAPVEHAVFELLVEPTTAMSEVLVAPSGADVELDGVALPSRSMSSWSPGSTLTAGSRAFQVESPPRAEPVRHSPTISDDGAVGFSRPPRRRSAPQRWPVVDAVRDATTASPALWERRPGHRDAFVLPIGVRSGETEPTCVHIDLAAERAVALAGSERFREALVRTILVEAATLHGPADLEVVVLTTAGRSVQWDWAKWLPHVRLDGHPAIWSSDDAISGWVERTRRRSEASTSTSTSGPITLVILDDPGLWNRRGAPARSILSNPPDDIRLVALCDDDAQAPSICTTLISQTDDGLARLDSFALPDDIESFRASLTEPTIAVRVARSLGGLVDLELSPRTTTTPHEEERNEEPVGIAELIGVSSATDILTRWADGGSRPAVAIGRRGRHAVEVGIDDAVTVVVGPSMGDAFDVAATALLAHCAEFSPERLWVVPLVGSRTARSEFLWRLPHATEPHDVDTPIDPGRLLARLDSLLRSPDGPDRVVVVTEATETSAAAVRTDRAWLASLADGVRRTSGVSLVMITDDADLATVQSSAVDDLLIRVERHRSGRDAVDHRTATISTDGRSGGAEFAPLQPSAHTAATLSIRPYVIGRSLTPLERRIQRQWVQSTDAPDVSLASVLAMLADAASQRPTSAAAVGDASRRVVPPPLPSRVELDDLFVGSPGDGIPLGLVDDPRSARQVTYWWEPGTGSLLVFGSRRSGVEHVLDTLALGIIDRFSPLDVRLVVIEPSIGRRRALHETGHEMRIVAPDDEHAMVDALDEIAVALHERSAPAAAAPLGGARSVVLIGDLVALRRRYSGRPLAARLDEVLGGACSPDSAVDVVAYAAEVDGAGPFASEAPRRLVGASSDHHALATLGVDDPSELDGVVGRCRVFPGADLVQLAFADDATSLFLARRSTGSDR